MTGLADEGHRAAIRRPHRFAVAICAGIKVAQRVCPRIVYADERMIAAIADEGELSAVRRPCGPLIAPARLEQLRRIRPAIERTGPDLTAARKRHTIAAR